MEQHERWATLIAKQRSGPGLPAQVLFYPVTDASFDTDSYHQFAEGYLLRRTRAGGRRRMEENVAMGERRLRSEIRGEQERIIAAVRSARDHWELAKAEDSFADLLERMADELDMASAHDRGRFLAAAHALRQSAAVNEHRYVTALSRSIDGT